MLNRLGVAFATIDVDTDTSLSSRYGDTVPVLFFGDREIGHTPFSEQELKAALQRAGIVLGAK